MPQPTHRIRDCLIADHRVQTHLAKFVFIGDTNQLSSVPSAGSARGVGAVCAITTPDEERTDGGRDNWGNANHRTCSFEATFCRCLVITCQSFVGACQPQHGKAQARGIVRRLGVSQRTAYGKQLEAALVGGASQYQLTAIAPNPNAIAMRDWHQHFRTF